MESLIPIINQLQDVCNEVAIALPIDLPQIVVVGAQSSGKSSVIESIVRREFLPRGTGIVTRRPLVIRLFKITDQDNDTNTNKTSRHQRHSGDWAKFKHLEKEFTDFDEVREEIEKETARLCGTNKGISFEPITLAVYSRSVVNLTLVDLPGIIKVPTGDQPEDIEIQIRELVINYIKNPNSIILAVTAANQDFVTSEAIKLAREVDPEGRRTLGVLTKLDIMDPGTDALEMLTGRSIPIKLGIIGVVNRSQQDIIDRKPIQKAIEDEAAFLKHHYPKIAEKQGQTYLSKRLSQLLMRHIRDCLPELKIRVNTLMSQHQAQLKSYGDPITNKAQTIMKIITKFSDAYCDTIKGGKVQIKPKELCGGARIQYIFRDSFGRALSAINPLETWDNKAILTVARNAAGTRTEICVPDVFELLVTTQIKRLEEPSLRCVELVHEEMGRFVRHCGEELHVELLRFPKLREKIEEILKQLLDQRLPVTREAVEDLVDYESAFIDTEHPRLRESYYEPKLHSGDGRISSSNSNNINNQQNGITSNGSNAGDESSLRHERELRDCESIARKIASYFNIARDEIKFLVPKAIMCKMVNHITSNLQLALSEEIYHHDLFDSLLSESDDIARRRKEVAERLVALKKAVDIINTIDYQKN